MIELGHIVQQCADEDRCARADRLLPGDILAICPAPVVDYPICHKKSNSAGSEHDSHPYITEHRFRYQFVGNRTKKRPGADSHNHAGGAVAQPACRKSISDEQRGGCQPAPQGCCEHVHLLNNSIQVNENN